jgi:hypothetical protein
MNKTTKSLLTLTVALVAIPLAYGASVHFKGGLPKFTDQGTTLKTCFSLAGLGNQDVTITVEAAGTISSTCTNPGGNVAPGQNKVPFRETTQVTIPSTQIKNGNVSVCLTTQTPATPTAVEAGCPNANWTTTINSVDFTNATVTVVQGGQIVLQRSFTL